MQTVTMTDAQTSHSVLQNTPVILIIADDSSWLSATTAAEACSDDSSWLSAMTSGKPKASTQHTNAQCRFVCCDN